MRDTVFYVYILECSDTTFYIGSTNNLEKRVHEHNHAKKGAHYTKLRRPNTLVYVEVFATLLEARRREALLKTYPRQKKKALISSGSMVLLEKKDFSTI